MENTVLDFTEDELRAIRSEVAKGATDEQFTRFLVECKQRNLVPGRHLYFQLNSVSEYSAEVGGYVKTKRAVHLTSIDAFRLIAQRSGEYEGQAEPQYVYLDTNNLPTVKSAIPLPEAGNPTRAAEPWAVEVAVYRKGFREPMKAVARFEAYAVYIKKDNSWQLNNMWFKRGSEQLCKCAEALALRKAFPEELGGLYIAEEIKDDPEPQQQPTPVTTVAAPAPIVAPAVDHTPAEGKDAPRPGEEKPKRTRKKAEESKAAPAPETPAPAAEAAPETAQPEESGTVDNDPPATSEERNGAAAVLRDFINNKGVDKEKLKNWILTLTGKTSTAEISKKGWDLIVKKLQDAGDKAAEMIGG